MQQESTGATTWAALSSESASVIERVSRAVVAVHGRRRIPSSGVHWRPGIVVTSSEALQRDEEITVTLPEGRSLAATLAGRDPSTDLAILKLEGSQPETAILGLPELADLSSLKVGHWVLVAGRTSEGGARAGLALVGVVGPAWRTWRGGTLDATVRLDRNLHPNFSGGPVIDHEGRVIGISTPALSRYGAVVIPAATVERVTSELEKKGHVGRGYLGIGMVPVRVPRKLRESAKLTHEVGLMVVGVESDSPADQAGVTLGDVLLALDASPLRDTDDLQAHLTAERVGKAAKASIIRGGMLVEVNITVGERPI
ncbi:MAG TPA: S1C family serine protease [Terriglobia bacterium]|nr:S1C family serine protease [Terriglobia bacterium]